MRKEWVRCRDRPLTEGEREGGKKKTITQVEKGVKN
jgi:hypothetical protein